jgi:hypothetical protein
VRRALGSIPNLASPRGCIVRVGGRDSDWVQAERAARYVFEHGTGGYPAVVVTDLQVVVAGSITELAAALHRPDTRQRWFPGIRATDHGDRTATLLR